MSKQIISSRSECENDSRLVRPGEVSLFLVRCLSRRRAVGEIHRYLTGRKQQELQGEAVKESSHQKRRELLKHGF